MHTTKRLVYHLYLYEGCFESKVYKLHFACLSRFAKIFDNAIFVLSLDDVNNETLIKTAEKLVLEKVPVKDTKFIIKQNDLYREAGTFYSEVVDNLDEFDGITFFGHVKGAGNEFSPKQDMIQIYHWVIAAYYLNLAYMDEVEWFLVTSPSFNVYGALKCYWPDVENKYCWLFSGTFFWLNCQRISGFLKKHEIPIPPLNNRYCAETFCGNIFEFDNVQVGSHKIRHVIGDPNERCMNWYKRAEEFIELFFDDEGEKQEYYKFRDEILNLIEA